MQFGKNERAAKERGMMSLFGEMEVNPLAFAFTLATDAREIPRKQILEWEKELIGLYLSRHPLAYLSACLKDVVTATTAEITEEADKQKVVLGGTITEIRRIITKKGDTMCMAQLEDVSGSIGVTIFPRLYEHVADWLIKESVVIVRGEVQVRNDEAGIICNSLEPLKAAEEEIERKHYQLWITIHLSGEDERSVSNDIMKVQELSTCLRAYPGRDLFELLVENEEWRVRLTPAENTVGYSRELHERIEAILGKNSIEAQLLEL
jgi:DNA polymerase-3 subunit alpha